MRGLTAMVFAVSFISQLASCTTEWTPDSYPVEVAVLSELGAEEQEAMRKGVVAWNEQVGEQVFNLRLAPGDRSKCGRVNLVLTNRLDRASSVGEAEIEGRNPCQATVRMRPDQSLPEIVRVTTHELGHVVLGASHSDDPASVMFWTPNVEHPKQTITEEDAEMVREAVQGAR